MLNQTRCIFLPWLQILSGIRRCSKYFQILLWDCAQHFVTFTKLTVLLVTCLSMIRSEQSAMWVEWVLLLMDLLLPQQDLNLFIPECVRAVFSKFWNTFVEVYLSNPSVRPSVRPSVSPSILCIHLPISLLCIKKTCVVELAVFVIIFLDRY